MSGSGGAAILPFYAAGGLSHVRRQDDRVVLTPCSDLSAASWIMASDRPWQQLVGFGPAGFPAYTRLLFLPDPAYEGQSENDVEIDGHAPSESAQLRAVLEALTRHTRASETATSACGTAGVRTSRAVMARGSSTGEAAPFDGGHGLRRRSRARCWTDPKSSCRTAPTTCFGGN
jgi:hypothetical protein